MSFIVAVVSSHQIWIQPEGKELCSTFVEFELLWTTILVEAAPFLEILNTNVAVAGFISSKIGRALKFHANIVIS